ncbi:MAG: hypothetical protein HOV68_03275 [Streptomycetaceae bacterium]|nr:hypothetical protein [Streptomycetaceae bacterium]
MSMRRAFGGPARARRSRAFVGLTAGVATVGLLAGCGIRATEGPINAGPPAQRPAQGATSLPGVAQHAIYLVRDGRPQQVQRGDAVDLTVPGTGSTPVPTPDDPARMSQIDRLLRELVKGPTPEEAAQGWTTALPAGGLGLANPVAGDPADLVRLDVDSFASLSPLALGQIVCTLQSAGKNASVSLAARTGPGRSQQCATFENLPVGAPKPAPSTGSAR